MAPSSTLALPKLRKKLMLAASCCWMGVCSGALVLTGTGGRSHPFLCVLLDCEYNLLYLDAFNQHAPGQIRYSFPTKLSSISHYHLHGTRCFFSHGFWEIKF